MDEKKPMTGMPFPPKPDFGGAKNADEPKEALVAKENPFFMAFGNEDGDKAIIVTCAEIVDDEVTKVDKGELNAYAKRVLEDGNDDRDLQIGEAFEGDNAMKDAEAEAKRLDDKYAPANDASDEDMIRAVEDARDDTTVGEEKELAKAEDKGEIPDAGKEPDIAPMLGQMDKMKKENGDKKPPFLK